MIQRNENWKMATATEDRGSILSRTLLEDNIYIGRLPFTESEEVLTFTVYPGINLSWM
jgi:hypothetical protein